MTANTRLLLAKPLPLMVCLLWMLTLTVPTIVHADLTLVDKGVSKAPIIIYEGAPPLTRESADTLAEYIERVSGAKPEVIEGLPDPIPARAIWVGYQPALKKLFPKVDFEFKHPEEILIASNDNHLVIAGRDVWTPEGMTVVTRRDKFEGIQAEYGTANAVYTFIQDHLNVRWLWPGELGIDAIPQDTIAVKPMEYRYHPQARSRNGFLNYSGLLQNRAYGISSQWVRYQRLQLDSMEVPNSHAFSTWWDKYHEEHPEYFALQPDGTRGLVSSPRTQKVCMSNPAVWDRWMMDVEEQIKNNPNQRVFSAADSDGWTSGHCICENCRAWDHPDGEKRRFSWKGLSSDYVALSDRQVTFTNTLARMLKKRYPDRNYLVAILGYGHSRPAPIKARPDDNVLVFHVSNFLGRQHYVDEASPNKTTHRQQFMDWAKLSHHIMWRPNTGSPAGWQQGFPDVSMTETIDNMKFMGENGFVGIFVDAVWEHWSTQGPMYYVMGQMLWDPSKDGHALLEDYYQRAYGPAAAPMKQYWKLMEATRTAYTEKYGYSDQSQLKAFYEQPLKEAQKLLDKANALAADGPQKYRDRLEFTSLGLEWTRLGMENQVLVREVQKDRQTEGPLVDKVRENWQKMRAIAESEKHPAAINKGPTGQRTPRMRGMHLESTAR